MSHHPRPERQTFRLAAWFSSTCSWRVCHGTKTETLVLESPRRVVRHHRGRASSPGARQGRGVRPLLLRSCGSRSSGRSPRNRLRRSSTPSWSGFSNNRSPETYEWYRYRLQRFLDRYPDLRTDDLRPFHVETWADSYGFSVTSKRNYLRSVKRCMKWAKKQGYIERNPIEDLEVPVAEHREVAITRDEFRRVPGLRPE